MPPARFRCLRSPRASPAAHRDQGVGGDAGTGAQLIGRRDAGARIKTLWRDHHLDRGGRQGVRAAATGEKTLAFVRAMAKRGIRIASVCSGAYVLAEAGLLDGRRATTHWQRTRHFLTTYPQGEARGRPHLHARRQHLDLGGDHRRHRPVAGDGGGRFRRRDRADGPPSSSCFITAAAAASRNSRRCWN